MSDRESFSANQLAGWVMRFALRLWPRESGEWGRALAAELPSTAGSWEAFRWTMGGLMVLMREWWRHTMGSWKRPIGVPAGGPLEAEWKNAPRVPRTPRWLTAILLLACLGMLLVPEVREAMGSVVDAWRVFLSNRYLPSPRSTEHIRKEAVRTQDPQLLALTALLSQDSKERREFADKAVHLDPSLTWIYFEIYHDGKADKDAALEAAKQLQKRDPDNAVAWLASADVIFDQVGDAWTKGGHGYDFSMAQPQIEQNPAWMAAMDRAFDAPRYDSYTGHVFELYRRAAERYKLREPVVLLNLLSNSAIPSLLAIRMYSTAQFDRAAIAEQAGNRAEAARLYWRVAAFGEEMRGPGRTEIEQLIGDAVEKGAYERLQPLLKMSGNADEAAMTQRALEGVKAEREYNPGRWRLRFENSWSGLTLFILTACAFICATALLFGLCFLYFAKRERAPVRWGFSLSSIIVDSCPVLLVLVLGGLFATYHPIAQLYDAYLSAPQGVSDFRGLIESLGVPYYALEVFPSGRLEAAVHFWTATTGALFLIATYILFRGKLSRRAEKQV